MRICCMMAATSLKPFSSEFPGHKHCKGVAVEAEAPINSLPDDILSQKILSLLTLKEAVATSIVSRRWRYLWTSLPFLHFGNAHVVQQMTAEAYIRMVNQVLRLHKGQYLQEFSVHYPLEDSSSCHIDNWVSFAITAGVSKLELNFSRLLYRLSIGFNENYLISPDLFRRLNGTAPCLMQLDCFKSLRDLSLNYVDIADELFETILSSCPSLECFILLESAKLINAKHTVPHLKLKRLEIEHCDSLENLEIVAPYLVSFKYRGSKINICIRAQQLVGLSIHSVFGGFEYPKASSLGLVYPERKLFVFGQFKTHFSYLEHLSIDASSFQEEREPNEVPVFSNLKQLTLVGTLPECLPLCYRAAASLISASPLLRRLEIHFPIVYRGVEPEMGMIPITPHKNLKEVFLSSFKGDRSNMEFVANIIDGLIALEKIQITTGIGTLIGDGLKYHRQDVAVGKKCDGLIREILPPKIQLKFLDF